MPHAIYVCPAEPASNPGRREQIVSGTLHRTMTEESRVEYNLPHKALEALLEGNRGKAIEEVQLERNISREDAREIVAAFILSQPSLQDKMRFVENRAGTKWGLMRWLILLQAIAVAVGYFLFFRDQW